MKLLRFLKQPEQILLLKLITIDEKLKILGINKQGREVLKMIIHENKTIQEVINEFNVSRQRIEQIYIESLNQVIKSIDIFFEKYDSYESLLESNKNLTLKLSDFIESKKDVLESKLREEVYKIEVNNLDLKFRTLRILKWLKVNNIGELMQHTENEIKNIRSSGVATINDINTELATFGLKLP